MVCGLGLVFDLKLQIFAQPYWSSKTKNTHEVGRLLFFGWVCVCGSEGAISGGKPRENVQVRSIAKSVAKDWECRVFEAGLNRRASSVQRILGNCPLKSSDGWCCSVGQHSPGTRGNCNKLLNCPAGKVELEVLGVGEGREPFRGIWQPCQWQNLASIPAHAIAPVTKMEANDIEPTI